MAMRLKKRKKRGSNLKISRKTRATFRKQLKRRSKEEKTHLKLPKSVLMLESDREQLKFIKEQTRQRAEKEERRGPEAPQHLQKLHSFIAECLSGSFKSVFIEVVDCRDIQGSRCYDCEQVVMDSGNKFFVFLVHREVESSVPESVEVIEDLGFLRDFERICVFGQPKSGKYRLTEAVEQLHPDAHIERIRVPATPAMLGAVLRGAADENSIDFLISFMKVWPDLDTNSLRDAYMLENFTTPEQCLLKLSQSPDANMRSRKILEMGAARFFGDVKSGKIGWVCTNNRFSFKF